MAVKRFSGLLILALVAVLSACEKDEGGGTNIKMLDGTWYGTAEYWEQTNPHVMRIVFSDGQVTGYEIDSTTSSATGPVTKESDHVYSFTLTDGTKGAVFLDGSGDYLVYEDNFKYFGVFQKDGISLPVFDDTDLVGQWKGITASVDALGEVTEVGSSAECTSSSSCTAKSDDKVTTSVTISQYHSGYGIYLGSYADTEGSSGYLDIILSPDKKFAGSVACDNNSTIFWPESCGFSAWAKK